MNTRRTNRNTPDPLPALSTLDRSLADPSKQSEQLQELVDESTSADEKKDKKGKGYKNKKQDAPRHPMQHRVPPPQPKPSKLTPGSVASGPRRDVTHTHVEQTAQAITSPPKGNAFCLKNQALSRTLLQQHSPQLAPGAPEKERALPQDFFLLPFSSGTEEQSYPKDPILQPARVEAVYEENIYDSTSAEPGQSGQLFSDNLVPSTASDDASIGNVPKSATFNNFDTTTDFFHPDRKPRKRKKVASSPEGEPPRKVAKTLRTTPVASQMNNNGRAASRRAIELQENAGSSRQDDNLEDAEMTDVQSLSQDSRPDLALRPTSPPSGSTFEHTDAQANLAIRYSGVIPRAQPSSTFPGQYQMVRPLPHSKPQRPQQLSTPRAVAHPMDTSGFPSRGLYYIDTQRTPAKSRKQSQPRQGPSLQRDELQSTANAIIHPSVRANPTTRAALWQALASGDPFLMSIAQKRRADELTAALTAMNSQQQQERTVTTPQNVTLGRRVTPPNTANNNNSSARRNIASEQAFTQSGQAVNAFNGRAAARHQFLTIAPANMHNDPSLLGDAGADPHPYENNSNESGEGRENDLNTFNPLGAWLAAPYWNPVSDHGQVQRMIAEELAQPDNEQADLRRVDPFTWARSLRNADKAGPMPGAPRPTQRASGAGSMEPPGRRDRSRTPRGNTEDRVNKNQGGRKPPRGKK